MKRFVVTLLMIVLMVSLSVSAAEKTPVTVWFFTGTPEVRDWADKFEAEFHKENPDIELSFELVTWPAIRETVMVAAASGTGPDIAYMAGNLIPVFASNGLTLPLNEYIERWSGKNDFLQSLLPSVTDESGNINAMPFAMWAYYDLYNMNVLQDSGVPIPKNWDELVSSARKLTLVGADNRVERYGYAGPQNETFSLYGLHLAMEQLGKGVLYIGDAKANINNDRGLRATRYLRDLWQAGMPDDNPSPSSLKGSADGGVAINGYATYNVTSIDPQNSAHLEPRRYVGPTEGTDQIRYNTGTIYILRSSKHPDEAWRVIASFLEHKTHADFTRTNKRYLPVMRSVLGRMDQVIEHPLVAKMAGLMHDPMTTYGAVHNHWLSVVPVAGPLVLSMLQGKVPIEGALEDAEQAANAVLAEKMSVK